ncbi:hypothetical protein [Microcoleus sp. Pol11C3]|uniref:hypothetical protein n=1 Tax=Microcoleus sp. Pol11C3 TaxID=3055390 RepID=UPI002FD52CA9
MTKYSAVAKVQLHINQMNLALHLANAATMRASMEVNETRKFEQKHAKDRVA